jgi:hypothetical protein
MLRRRGRSHRGHAGCGWSRRGRTGCGRSHQGSRGRKPGGTAGATRRGAMEAAPGGGGGESSELGTSSNMAACGMVDLARRGVPMGGTTCASFESKKIQTAS